MLTRTKQLNPQPSTLNPQPSTLNPQPSTLNPQPSTLNPQPSTLNPQPSILIQIVNTLIELGANVHHADRIEQTAMHRAAMKGFPEVCMDLWKAGGLPERFLARLDTRP